MYNNMCIGGSPGRNQGYPGASANSGANAFSGSDAGFPQFGGGDNGLQSGRYKQPGSGSPGYPSGRPNNQGFGGNNSGYPGSQGAGGQGGSYPGSQENRGQGGVGGGDGYPSGGPNGPRGSGYWENYLSNKMCLTRPYEKWLVNKYR